MTEEIRVTHSAGGVVLNEQNEVIVVNQRGKFWSLPKGHIDPGETPLQAAEREIREESGASGLKYIQKLGRYERFKLGPNSGESDDMSEKKVITMFLFHAHHQLLKPEDPHNPEARWVPLEEVEALLSHPKDKEFFASILPNIKPAP
jgi:8-oxo-dGTP pyrophosphatase MutT (NUDIX family)